MIMSVIYLNKYAGLSIFALIFISGCVGTTQPSGNQTSTIDRQNALDAINNAKTLYSIIQNETSRFELNLSNANSRGVDTSTATAKYNSIKNQITTGINILNTAINNYNLDSYSNALTNAQQSISQLETIKDSLPQLIDSLNQDYQKTIDKYANLIEDSEKSFREAEAFVAKVKNSGIGVSSQERGLLSASDNLNTVKGLFKNNQFSTLSSQLNKVKTESDRIKEEV